MSIRLLDWRDIAVLHRYRNQCVFLHTALVLTHGNLFIPGAMLSPFTPGMDIVTAVSNNDHEDTLIGQTMRVNGAPHAQITFLAPGSLLDSPKLTALLEYLAMEVGERGAYRLIADVDEGDLAFESLRRAGMAIYSRQRVWKAQPLAASPSKTCWEPAVDQDTIQVRSLYHNLVPGLVQQVEVFPTEPLNGLVYRQHGELQAYVELKYGHRGIWVQPLLHPNAQNLTALLADLLANIPNHRSRPVYFGVRSYLSWLEPALEELGADVVANQAVMVKHLAIHKKATRQVSMPSLETGRTEISTPIARSEKQS